MSEINLFGDEGEQSQGLDQTLVPNEPDLQDGQSMESSSLRDMFNAFSECMEGDIESWQEFVLALAIGGAIGLAIVMVGACVGVVGYGVLIFVMPQSQTQEMLESLRAEENQLPAAINTLQSLIEPPSLAEGVRYRIVVVNGLPFKDTSYSGAQYK